MLVSRVPLLAHALLDPVAVLDVGWGVRTNLTMILSLHAQLVDLTSEKFKLLIFLISFEWDFYHEDIIFTHVGGSMDGRFGDT